MFLMISPERTVQTYPVITAHALKFLPNLFFGTCRRFWLEEVRSRRAPK